MKKRNRKISGRIRQPRARGKRFLFAFFSVLLLPLLVLCLTDVEKKSASVLIDLSVASPHRSASLFNVQNYATFSHSVRAHADINCNSCHQRPDNSATPRFAGHAACIDCHLNQFVTPQSPLCAICHSNVQTSPAPLKNFPANFNERFNMKFDHAAHNTGDGRPSEGCAACHQPTRRGSANLSIPVNLNAHNNCYTCHTPNRNYGGRDIGSCNTCHALGGYRRTSTNAAAFQASFSHAQHSARQKLACADCHSVKAGMPQSRQVTSPVLAQHFSSNRATNCMTCHNDRRAFGEKDFANCKLCHTRASFQMPR